MKKILLVSAFASALLLAACNTDEGTTEKDTPKEDVVTEQPSETNGQASETPETTEETPAATETPATEQPADEDTVTELKIYVSDANAESIELGETVTHSLKKDGPMTPFIIEKLGLTQYYNSHAVSADEKTITLDFKESLLSSNVVQGSAGGFIFAGQIYASFFQSIDTLQSIQLRIDGKEVETDHMSFSGAVTREDYLEAYSDVQ